MFSSILLPVIFLLTAVIIVVGKIVVSKSFHKRVLEKIERKKTPYYSLFLSAYVLITILNFVFVIAEIAGVIHWCVADGDAIQSVLIKLLVFLLSLLLAFFAALFSSLVLKAHTDDRQIKLPETIFHVSTFYVWWICGKCKGDEGTAAGSSQSFTWLLMTLNIELFAVIVTWNLIPIVLLIFVNPVKTAAGVSFVLSLFLLSPIILTLIFQTYASTQSHSKFIKKLASTALNICITFCILYVVIIWVSTYQNIVERGADTGGAVMFAVTFLPPTILAAAAIGGRRLLHKVDPDSQKETTVHVTRDKDNVNIKITPHTGDSIYNCNRDFDIVVTASANATVTTNEADAALTNTAATGNGSTNAQMQTENNLI